MAAGYGQQGTGSRVWAAERRVPSSASPRRRGPSCSPARRSDCLLAIDEWVLEPGCQPVSIVACLPHGGLDYPAELTGALAVSPDVLWSDWLTRDLYAFLPELGITTITTSFSRFVADVNRDPRGEQHGGFLTSVVAARMPRGP